MSTRSIFSVRVEVPATSANLGPGFDVLGLALDRHESVRVLFGGAGPRVRVRAEGPGAERIPTGADNLAVRAIRRVYREARRPMPALDVALGVRLPVAGGLGSSSAAIVGGLVAANAALGRPFTTERLLGLATEMEGHPDNVAPALLGGLCMAVAEGKNVRCVAWRDAGLFRGLRAAVAVPRFPLLTSKSRGVLPARVPRADAVFNAARVALFLGAVRTGRWELLREAMRDRLHQPYRAPIVPGLAEAMSAATRAGAYGAALSGAGPSVLALVAPAAAPAAARAMASAFARRGIEAESLVLKIDTRGAFVAAAARKSPQ